MTIEIDMWKTSITFSVMLYAVAVNLGCATLEDWTQKIPSNEPDPCAVQIIENVIYIKALGTPRSFDDCHEKPESLAPTDPRKPANK